MTERVALFVSRIGLSAFLLVIIPLAAHLTISDTGGAPEIIAWGFLLISAFRAIYLAFSPKPRILEIAFWLFVYVFFGLAAISQISRHSYPLSSGDYTESQLIATQIRIAVGILSFMLGVWLWNRLSGGRKPVKIWNNVVVSESRCRIVGILGVTIALALIAKTGIRYFFESRDALQFALFDASGKVVGVRVYQVASKSSGSLKQLMLNIPVFVVMVSLIGSGLWRRHKVLLLSVIAVSIVTNNPISNPRAWASVVAVGLIAAFVDLSQRSRHVYFALGLLITTVFSLGYLGIFRSSSVDPYANESISTQLVNSPDYGMFQQEVNATLYVTTNGFTNGSQLLGSALVYIPRSIWASKPGSTGQLVEQESGDQNSLFSSTLWTEFFIDFGYPELILGFLVLGYLFAHFDDVFYRVKSGAMKFVVPVAAAYSIILIRGSLQPELAYGIPIFLAFFLCTKRDVIRSESATQVQGILAEP